MAIKQKKYLSLFLLFLSFSLFVLVDKAYAYLTPGAVTYVIQIIIAFSIGGVLSIRIFWNKLSAIYKRLFSDKGADNEGDPASPERNS